MTRNVFGDCCMTKKSSSKRGQKQDTVTESNIHLTWHPTLTQFYHCHPKKAVKIACRTTTLTSRCTILRPRCAESSKMCDFRQWCKWTLDSFVNLHRFPLFHSALTQRSRLVCYVPSTFLGNLEIEIFPLPMYIVLHVVPPIMIVSISTFCTKHRQKK